MKPFRKMTLTILVFAFAIPSVFARPCRIVTQFNDAEMNKLASVEDQNLISVYAKKYGLQIVAQGVKIFPSEINFDFAIMTDRVSRGEKWTFAGKRELREHYAVIQDTRQNELQRKKIMGTYDTPGARIQVGANFDGYAGKAIKATFRYISENYSCR